MSVTTTTTRTFHLRRSAIILFVILAPIAYFGMSLPLAVVAFLIALVAVFDLNVQIERTREVK